MIISNLLNRVLIVLPSILFYVGIAIILSLIASSSLKIRGIKLLKKKLDIY